MQEDLERTAESTSQDNNQEPFKFGNRKDAEPDNDFSFISTSLTSIVPWNKISLSKMKSTNISMVK